MNEKAEKRQKTLKQVRYWAVLNFGNIKQIHNAPQPVYRKICNTDGYYVDNKRNSAYYRLYIFREGLFV